MGSNVQAGMAGKVLIGICRFINGVVASAQSAVLRDSLKSCGKNVTIQVPLEIRGGNFVEIGDDVSIAAFVHIWGHGGVVIGNRVMIASHTAITSLTHDYTSPEMHRTLIRKSVSIEDDVWIGTHAIILPGVTIGKGAVIGAGALITKDVPPGAVIFGNPAKVWKYRDIKDL